MKKKKDQISRASNQGHGEIGLGGLIKVRVNWSGKPPLKKQWLQCDLKADCDYIIYT